jgi:hypothetical protein
MDDLITLIDQLGSGLTELTDGQKWRLAREGVHVDVLLRHLQALRKFAEEEEE